MSTLSFAAGVTGDLSIIDPPRSGQRVVLRIPPELPAGSVRAAPLPPLISTASAEALPRVERVAARFEGATIPAEYALSTSPKPAPRLEIQLARVTPKLSPTLASATHERKAAQQSAALPQHWRPVPATLSKNGPVRSALLAVHERGQRA
ncbi:MAG: hypothetical protein ACT4OF_01105 [Caulobacteraceae bacterium]